MTCRTMNRLLLTVAFIALLEGSVVASDKDWTSELSAIADKCGLPRTNLKWVDGNVKWLNPEDASYEATTCVFEELKTRGIPMKQGFVSDGS